MRPGLAESIPNPNPNPNWKARAGRITVAISMGMIIFFVTCKLEWYRREQWIARSAAQREDARARSLAISSAAHDLRSPLCAVAAGCGILKAHYGGGEGEAAPLDLLNQVLELMEAATTSGLNVVDQMLLTTRLLNGQPLTPPLEACDLAATVRSAVALCETAVCRLRKGGERGRGEGGGGGADQEFCPVVIEIEAGLQVCSTARDWLHRMVVNLVTNAFHFSTHPEQQVTVTLGRAQGQPGMLVCRVVDEKPGGVSPVLRPWLFEAFRCDSHQAPGGTGLGLFTVMAMATALGGEAGYEPREGDVGSAFWFRVPYHPLDSTVEGRRPLM